MNEQMNTTALFRLFRRDASAVPRRGEIADWLWNTAWAGISIVLLIPMASRLTAGDSFLVRGRVTDPAGNPVSGATVSPFWSANGPRTKGDGTRYNFADRNDLHAYWSREGQMSPYLDASTTDTSGDFQIDVDSFRHAVVVIGPDQKMGGIVLIPESYDGRRLECRLQDLVSVSGNYEWGDAHKNVWAHSYVSVIGDESRVLANKRIISCGSFNGIVKFRIPAGRYEIRSYGSTDGGETLDLSLKEVHEFVVSPGIRRLQLGDLKLSPAAPSAEQVKAEGVKQGTWTDLERRFGQRSPEWYVSLSMGVPNDVTVSRYRGKWLLISFWAFGCPTCLKDKLPELAEFYRSHSKGRDRFEVVAICIDPEREITSNQVLRDRFAPLVKHLWSGRELPYPVIVDSSHQTWKNFGLSELGSTVLVSPDGVLIDGGVEELADLLR